MIRRSPRRVVVGAAIAALALSSCATFDNADTVVRVGDTDVTIDQFEPLATEYFGRPDVFNTTPAEAGRGDAAQARPLLSAVVLKQLTNRFLDRYGVDATGVRLQFIAEVLAPTPAGSLSNAMQTLIADVDNAPTGELLAQIPPPGEAELRALYADAPATTGLLCMRHILLDDEADAEQVLAELAAGADFATLAVERSTDPTAADNGGALGSDASDCIPLQTVLRNFDLDFVGGALAAREGVPSAPVESAFGWHIILARPWDEIADSVLALHVPGDSGGYLFDGYIVTESVEVDPRFGSWDPVTASVVPIG